MSYSPTFATNLRDILVNKTVYADSLSSFPDPVGGVITLETDTSYILTKTLNFEGNKLEIPTNGSVLISSTNPFVNELQCEPVSASAVFIEGTVNRLDIRDVNIISNNTNGKCFNLTGGSDPFPFFSLSRARVESFDSIGSIGGVSFITQNIGWENNNGGVSLSNINFLILLEHNFRSQVGDHVNISGTLTGGFVDIFAAIPASGDSVFNIDSGTSIATSLFFNNSTFVDTSGGAWFDVSGLDQTDDKIFVAENNFNLVDSATFIEVSANYTATQLDKNIDVDTSGGPVTITLPTAVGLKGNTININKKFVTSPSLITISPDGSETIDGQSSILVEGTESPSVTLQSNNVGWSII